MNIFPIVINSLICLLFINITTTTTIAATALTPKINDVISIILNFKMLKNFPYDIKCKYKKGA